MKNFYTENMFTAFIFSLFLAISGINIQSSSTPFSSSEKISQPTIHIAGDVMLSRSVGAMTKKYGTTYITDGFHPFSDAKHEDFIFFNVESPFSLHDRDTHEPSFTFASNTKNLEILKWLKNDANLIISLANNHMFNANFEGFATTLQTLNDAKMLHTGLSKGEREKFLEIVKNEKKWCFGAYTYDGKQYFNKKTGEKWWVNSLDDAKNDIFDMQKSGCDEKIFSLHWGREYKFEPTENQENLAHFLVDNGATLIVGAHSHILGKHEKYQGKWIFYSLGNAIFDQEWGREKCEKNMDCIFDEKLKKDVVPTHIGTKFSLNFPYDNEPKMTQWDIKVGKMIER